MSKVRIYELARETGLSNKEVIRRLDELGVQAKSHSSTVELADAERFRESLGRQREERRRQQEEKERQEAEEYLSALQPERSAEEKARRILPPHLREGAQQPAAESEESSGEAEEEAPRPAARRFRPATTPFRPGEQGGVSVGGTTEEPAESAPTEDAPAAEADVSPGQAPAPEETTAAGAEGPELGQTEQPQAPEPQPSEPSEEPVRATPQSEERHEEAPPAASGGQEREERHEEREEQQGVPGVPRPGTPPRPGEPIRRPPRAQSPASSGTPVEPKRRVEPDLPKEGSGKRSIPPPVRAAPRDQAPSQAPPRERTGGTEQNERRGQGGPAAPERPSAPAPGGGPPKKGKKKKGKKKKDQTPQEQFEEEAQPRQKPGGPVKATVSGPVDVTPGITVGEFAKAIGVNPTDIVRVLFGMGEMITVTQTMSQELVELVAAEMDVEVNFVTPEELEFGEEEEDTPEQLLPRAPVVTVMGHVDHGKTLLLDAVRQTDVVGGEAGGITQHIGAYQVRKDGRAVTFIDTPGHEAFTQMRARGAKVTDVAILVVAADDGVKPQTIEAINHIRAAEVPIIVAVNKVDKPDANPTRVRTELTQHGLVAEEFGGDTTMVDVSAKTGDNLDELLEMVLLQADVSELTANPDRSARGAVVEGHLDRGRGPVATVLVQSGTLRVGDDLVAGIADCKVRAMFDHEGEKVSEATPSQPVQVIGWSDVPDAGDEFRVVEDERSAREIAGNRQSRQRRVELAERKTISLEELGDAIEAGQLQTLNVIIKGDVAGSTEAVADALESLELPEEIRLRIVHKGVGAITENDVSLAEASDAIIIGFNVRPEANARTAIEQSGVDVRQYSIIYQAVEDVERAVKGMLVPEYEEVTTGRAEVREVFKVPRVGYVFGCYVTDGEIRRHASVRVLRDGVVVAQDRLTSLKRYKDDVTEVARGYECGVGLDKFQDVKAGDELEVFEQREVART